MKKLKLSEVLKKYTVPDKTCMDYARQYLEKERQKNRAKIIVLDDDPTGVQTVHDVNVYTDWSYENILSGFEEEKRMFYVLTNSRSFTQQETISAHQQIASNITKVSQKLGREYILISRSDSTLRGHWPLETEVLKQTIENESSHHIDGEIIAPFFKQGGRYTIDNIHYVAYGDELVPAGETEFAKDKTFGYVSSHLGEWIEEKSAGRYKKEDLCYIGLDELRTCDIKSIEQHLLAINRFNKIIVNALDICDIEIFCAALLAAINKGKHFILRTAASLPKVLAGISDKPLLTREELLGSCPPNNGGLIIIGSHVKKTTEQLEELKKYDFIDFIEFNQHLILEPEQLNKEIERVATKCNALLSAGRTAAVYTRRQIFEPATADKEEQLKISIKISEALVKIVENIQTTPAFIIAKGGITSSDIGVKALKVKRALVLGQILDGVPVWRTGTESRFPGIPYVIFPGNVGDRLALAQTAMILCGKKDMQK
jgi:uncharacterized protein YgbK (DUF1537 family)